MRSALLVVLAACGDNLAGGDEPCAPPENELPADGALIDPSALPLDGCITGGLTGAVGRWFLVDPAERFVFDYPRIAGTCETGFARVGEQPDDHDLADDGATLHTWSDGTRLFTRRHFHFEAPGFTFDRVTAVASCMRDDGQLASVVVVEDSDRGTSTFALAGARFGAKDAPASGLALVGELATSSAGMPLVAYNLVVDGGFAYVAGPFGLDIVDVTTPSTPRAVGHVDGYFNDVRVAHGGGKTVAFVADQSTRGIDVTDPAAPHQVAEIPEYSHSLQLAGTTLYLATYTEAIPAYDVSNPVVPVRLGAATIPNAAAGVHDLTVDGQRIYANYTTEGLVELDVAGGLAKAVELARVPSSYSHASAASSTFVLSGDEGMTMTAAGGAFLRVLDRGDLHELGRYQSRPEVGIHNIELHGDRAYIAYYQDGARVIDLSDPAHPREVAHYNTWNDATAFGGPFEGAFGIRVVGDLVYVADSIRGLVILREL